MCPAGVLLAAELRMDADGLADAAESAAMVQNADSVTAKLLDSMRASAVRYCVVLLVPLSGPDARVGGGLGEEVPPCPTRHEREPQPDSCPPRRAAPTLTSGPAPPRPLPRPRRAAVLAGP